MTDTSTTLAGRTGAAEPAACQCTRTPAPRGSISPTHPGHCCFIPADRTCHAREVAAWEATR